MSTSGLLVMHLSKTFTVSNCTGIEEVSKNNRITAWPNPVRGELTLTIENITENCKVEIFTLTGDKLFTVAPSENVIAIEMMNYPNGLYVVKITSNDSCSVLKIVKE